MFKKIINRIDTYIKSLSKLVCNERVRELINLVNCCKYVLLYEYELRFVL